MPDNEIILYELHEKGGEYEDYTDCVIKRSFNYNEILEAKKKAEKEEKEAIELSRRCNECPICDSWDRKDTDKLAEECRAYCDCCKLSRDEDGDLNCENYHFHMTDYEYEISGVHIKTDGFVLLSAEAYNQLLEENKKLKEELEYAESHPPICIAP